MRSRYYLTGLLFIILFNSSCKKEETIDDTHIKLYGKTYNIVKIGGKSWTNANFEGAEGVYRDNNNHPEYGKFYTYAEVKALKLPKGWRLPTKKDFVDLTKAIGVTDVNDQIIDVTSLKKLTSSTLWRYIPGNNQSGFNAYPGGYYFDSVPSIDGTIAQFWTAEGLGFRIQENYNNNLKLMFYSDNDDPGIRYNIRFIKD
ncbi:FISUMP domain-containing protein [Mucilaginibacter litoreus]|uniref:FISUMP domain-containing protein n=1 Tax=Mucilaginibacter litoreus TaxID=1048221 RepID=A0ABW3ARQ7_9SPHI